MRQKFNYLFYVMAALVAASFAQAGGFQDNIAFTSTRDGNAEVYIMQSDGTGQTNLTNNAFSDAEPDVSADGTKVAFNTDRDGNSEIYSMNVDGSGQTNLTNDAGNDSRPSYGALAAQIAFQTDRDGNSEIYIMNADGTAQTNLSNHASTDTHPVFSRDGTQVVFVSNRTGSTQVYIVNVDGTGLTQITNSIQNSTEPDLSADGTQIIYSSNRTGSWQVYRSGIDGSGLIPLTTAGGGDPTYSPDGSKIAFSTTRTGNLEVYEMNLNGSSETNVSNNASSDGAPAYGPPLSTEVLPSSFTVHRGLLDTGGLSDVFASDDSHLIVKAHIALFAGESPLQVIFTGTSPTQTPSELRFKLEASVSTPGLMQTVSMLNYVTGLYEVVDFWAGTPSDSIVEVTVTTTPERFVQAGTGQMKCKVSYSQVGITLHFPWRANFDHTVWTVVN